MKSKEYYISLTLSHAGELKKNFGVKSFRKRDQSCDVFCQGMAKV